MCFYTRVHKEMEGNALSNDDVDAVYSAEEEEEKFCFFSEFCAHFRYPVRARLRTAPIPGFRGKREKKKSVQIEGLFTFPGTPRMRKIRHEFCSKQIQSIPPVLESSAPCNPLSPFPCRKPKCEFLSHNDGEIEINRVSRAFL